MFEQCQQCHRFETADRGLCGKPREDTGRCLGKRIAAGVFHRDIPAHQRGGDAAAERAIRRHQRGGLAVLHRFAKRDRDGERFFLGVGRFDHRHRRDRGIGLRFEHQIAGALLPDVGLHRRPHRF